MIGDEFVSALPHDRTYVQKFEIVEGLTDELNEWLDQFNVRHVTYSTFVDTMSPAAQPMLVAVLEGTALNQEEPHGDSHDDADEGTASSAEDVPDRAVAD